MTRWTGGRIYMAVALLASSLGVGAAAPQVVAATTPTVVAGRAVPTRLEHLANQEFSFLASDSLGNIYGVVGCWVCGDPMVRIYKSTPSGSLKARTWVLGRSGLPEMAGRHSLPKSAAPAC